MAKYICKTECYGFRGRHWAVGDEVDATEAEIAGAAKNGLKHFEASGGKHPHKAEKPSSEPKTEELPSDPEQPKDSPPAPQAETGEKKGRGGFKIK